MGRTLDGVLHRTASRLGLAWARWVRGTKRVAGWEAALERSCGIFARLESQRDCKQAATRRCP